MASRTSRSAALLAAVSLLAAVAACGTDPGPSADGGTAGSAAGAEAPEGFTLVATGDILVHDSVIRQARSDAGAEAEGHDFGRMLAGAAPVTEGADLAICHMETVYGPDGGPFSGYPMFVTPPEIAGAIKDAGYHSCSTASNHTLDAGPEGVTRTLEALDAAGLRHAGAARSAEEHAEPTLLEAGGATVAQLAYTYDTNGIPVPADQPWLVNLIDPQRIIADARAARAAGADVVVVSMHWGTEWQEEPDQSQLDLAETLTSSRDGDRPDIDLIIGTHAHVPQAYEKLNDVWVVYGMGDQLAGRMNDPRGQMGSAARFTFDPPAEGEERWTVSGAEVVPHLVDNDPLALVNLPRAVAEDPGRREYQEALELISAAAFSRGAADDGLTIGE
ncbi:CapA family protein [Streptomyces otsuchiensis]|uniref:CapA family protein n=1 Tax=Streptomyces otsuchiensis TaxID=2681388 RepID=UPI001032073D|nr:CapA family protein [Streptomyces otsuchiensis]